MPALSPLTTLPPFLLASALSAYALYLSKTNISLLQKYESASEKAAQWSNTAAQRLRKTRTTQASGTVAVRTFPNPRPPSSLAPPGLPRPQTSPPLHRPLANQLANPSVAR
jgi:hypothetical protein